VSIRHGGVPKDKVSEAVVSYRAGLILVTTVAHLQVLESDVIGTGLYDALPSCDLDSLARRVAAKHYVARGIERELTGSRITTRSALVLWHAVDEDLFRQLAALVRANKADIPRLGVKDGQSL
jgi:hypothetical protein